VLFPNSCLMQVTDDNRTLQLSVISYNYFKCNHNGWNDTIQPGIALWLCLMSLMCFCYNSIVLLSVMYRNLMLIFLRISVSEFWVSGNAFVCWDRCFVRPCLVVVVSRYSLEIICGIIYANERFTIVAIGNLIIVNVYFPCAGTADRLFVVEEVLSASVQ